MDEEELHTVMMMMIGELNASHTGVSGGAGGGERTVQTRYPGFDLVADASGLLQGGPHLQGWPGRSRLPEDQGRPLHRRRRRPGPEDQRQLLAAVDARAPVRSSTSSSTTSRRAKAPGTSPSRRSTANAFGDLQYARWVDERRAMVTKASNGEIGYLHIRAMDAPSLRQFQLDLAANRTKKALVIDQRFNGGGGIDQELLAILAGSQYQYTMGRDAGIQQSRPQNFYGPMVVMQNERSASDAEMFPAGFKALGLGKVVGVPTMGAVIGTGSYTLMDGSTIRTPGSGVWTASGENMENYGVPPDVYIDNTPEDFLKGRDAQIEKAVEVLKEQLAGRRTTTSQQ